MIRRYDDRDCARYQEEERGQRDPRPPHGVYAIANGFNNEGGEREHDRVLKNRGR